MVKLNDRKIHWIIQQKLRDKSTEELALIQWVSRRRIEQIQKTYRRYGIIPALKKPGRFRKASISIQNASMILKAYDRLKVNALTLKSVLKHNYGKHIPHNRIHTILTEAGRALPQPSKQNRCKWVRYEREHSMSLWHVDWKQLDNSSWWIAYMDDASRLIVGYGVFQ